jgi:hypothetical protein
MLLPGSRHALLLCAFALLPLAAPQSARADLLLTSAGTGTGTAGSVGASRPAVVAQVHGPRDVAVAAGGVT